MRNSVNLFKWLWLNATKANVELTKERKFWMKKAMWPWAFQLSKDWWILYFQIVSNAFVKLKKITRRWCFFSNDFWIEFRWKSSSWKVDLPARKSHSLLKRRLLNSGNQKILKFTIFSNNLQKMNVRRTGRKLSISMRFSFGFALEISSAIFHEF